MERYVSLTAASTEISDGHLQQAARITTQGSEGVGTSTIAIGVIQPFQVSVSNRLWFIFIGS
jgi:hypothetical protein